MKSPLLVKLAYSMEARCPHFSFYTVFTQLFVSQQGPSVYNNMNHLTFPLFLANFSLFLPSLQQFQSFQNAEPFEGSAGLARSGLHPSSFCKCS